MSLLALELKPSKEAIRVDPLAQALIFFSMFWGLFAFVFGEYELNLALQGAFFAMLAGIGLSLGYTSGFLSASKVTKYITVISQGILAFGLISVGQITTQVGIGLIPGGSQPSFAFLAAIAEEVTFRGVLFMLFLRSLSGYGRVGLIAAAGLSSAVFSWFHFRAYGFDIYSLAAIFVTGIILALAMWETKMLSVPILAHIILNAIPTAGYGLLMISLIW